MLLLLTLSLLGIDEPRSVLSQQVAAELDNVNCHLQSEVVPTDNTSYFRYFPYYVKLHRCRGSVVGYDPSVRTCDAIETEPVFALVTEVSMDRGLVIELTNHTNCSGVCVQEPRTCTGFEYWSNETCGCRCKFDSTPVLSPCCSPRVWSQSRCMCRCPTDPHICMPRKVWSGESCSCVCKSELYRDCSREDKKLDEGTCLCIARPATGKLFPISGGVSVAALVVALISEALVLIFAYVLCYQYCFKHHWRPRYEALQKGRKQSRSMLSAVPQHSPNDAHSNDIKSSPKHHMVDVIAAM